MLEIKIELKKFIKGNFLKIIALYRWHDSKMGQVFSIPQVASGFAPGRKY